MPAALEGAPQDFLRPAIRVDVGGVDEVDAVFQGVADDPLRFALQADASGLATGTYDWTMTVTAYYGSVVAVREFTGKQEVVNLTSSEFGSGWQLAGLERLEVGTGRVTLVGDQAILAPLLSKEGLGRNSRVSIHHASEVITMEDKPLNALKRKKDSSMVRAIELVKNQGAGVVVSCGNTGALMAGGTRTCETSTEKLRMPCSLACQTAIAFAGAVVSKPMAKNTTCLSGLARAILRQSSGE